MPVVEGYRNKWGRADLISRDAKTFIKETEGLFGALGDRIKREDNELYKTFDQLKAA